MAFHLENKVIFISGGAGDIGSAIVKGFVDESCRIILGDLNLEAAENLKAQFPEADIFPLQTDITNEDSIEQAVKTVGKLYGRVDVLVNVAGILCRKSVFETEKSDFEKSCDRSVLADQGDDPSAQGKRQWIDHQYQQSERLCSG